MPCDNKQPIRYLLTLNRHDTVKQLRAQLLVFLDEDESLDLIIAEVFDNHIARVLVSLNLCLPVPLISLLLTMLVVISYSCGCSVIQQSKTFLCSFTLIPGQVRGCVTTLILSRKLCRHLGLFENCGLGHVSCQIWS